jgi:hypothetical protein
MQIKVSIEDYGVFEVDSDRINDLLNWLSTNSGISIKPKNQIVREVISNQFTGRELILEQDK